MLPSLPLDLVQCHILPNLSLENLVNVSRVSPLFKGMAEDRINKVYKHDGSYRISPIYEEYLQDETSLGLLYLMIYDKFSDPNDSLYVSEALLGDRRINSPSRPFPANCDPEIVTLLFKHCTMEAPVKLTADIFDNVPFELLESHLKKKGVSGVEMFEVLLNCKNIMRVTLAVPFLYEASSFLRKLLETMDPANEALSDLEPDIESICLSCRLCTKESEIPYILSHISRYRNHSSNLHFLFYHLIMMKIHTRLACRLYGMMPADEELKRTVVLAVAHFNFDMALYKAIRKDTSVELDMDSDLTQEPRGVYLAVEAAIMSSADEQLILALLSNPLMEHDADLVYTAAFRGYSEQVLVAIMNTKRQGWYRSAHCLFYMVPFGMDRLPLTFTLTIPPSVLRRLFEASVKSEFYLMSGPEVYADRCYAPFLEWLLEKPSYSRVAAEMARRDRFQRMPQSLAVIWRHLIRVGLDYRISLVSECYRTVHRRRLKAFFQGDNLVDTADTFQSCLP